MTIFLTITTIVLLTTGATVLTLMHYIDAKIDPLVYQIKRLLDDLQVFDQIAKAKTPPPQPPSH